jgi:hypothetical protein
MLCATELPRLIPAAVDGGRDLTATPGSKKQLAEHLLGEHVVPCFVLCFSSIEARLGMDATGGAASCWWWMKTGVDEKKLTECTAFGELLV